MAHFHNSGNLVAAFAEAGHSLAHLAGIDTDSLPAYSDRPGYIYENHNNGSRTKVDINFAFSRNPDLALATL